MSQTKQVAGLGHPCATLPSIVSPLGPWSWLAKLKPMTNYGHDLQFVQLTDHGRKVLAEALQTLRTTLHETFGSHLADSEVAGLRGTLRLLLEKNGAWQEARCNPTLAKPR